jgi:hemerythrin-like domain-containing protein
MTGKLPGMRSVSTIREEMSVVDAIELLRADHQRVLRMLAELEAGPVAGAATDAEQVRARRELVTELVIAESQHEAVEEQYFWPMVRNEVPDGETLAARAVEQEDAAKQVLHALDKAHADQSDFEPMVRRIIADGRDHIDYEEIQVWPKVLATVDKKRLAELGEQIFKAKQMAPTRPHPAAPSTPGMLKAAGPAVAAADKLRDTLTGRGRD